MPIIDFLLDNLFFVIIVLGFLSSIIAKNKSAERERQQESQRQQTTQRGNQPYHHEMRTGNQNPTLGDSRIERPLENSMERPISRSMERGYEKAAVKVEPTFIEINDAARKEIQQKKDRIAAESPIYAEDLLAEGKSAYNSKDNPAFLAKSDSVASQAIQGMMWSEIFGPPRASKPFKHGSYRK